MSTSEKRKILDDIKKSGYDLEVDVAASLMEKGWSVFPEFAYFDDQAKRVRTIDMVGFHPEPKMTFSFMPTLILECKKSEKPWVFYSTPFVAPGKVDFLKQLGEFRFEDSFLKAGEERVGMDLQFFLSSLLRFVSAFPPNFLKAKIATPEIIAAEMVKIINDIHFFNPDLPRAHSCHVATLDKKEDAPDDFQKALYQIRGAYYGVCKAYPNSTIFATIVLKGKSFVYTKTGSNENLELHNHVLASAFWLTERFPSGNQQSANLLPPVIVDVVRDSYFRDYLNLLEKDFAVLRSAYETIHKALRHK